VSAENGRTGLATELERLRAQPHLYPEWEALLDLVERAARRPTAMRSGKRSVPLERGELVTSERELAERWGWSRKSVQRFLLELQSRGELLRTDLATKKQGAGTKLTLVNYTTYPHSGTKRNQVERQAKSPPARELARSPHQARSQQTPHTPPISKTPLGLLATRTPQGGSGGGVASARDVENNDACGDLASAPPSEQLEIPPAENAEHLRFAEELADTLNRAQADNGRVDRESYRPVAAHHRGTLAAALAIKNAGVPIAAATQYVWLEGQKYKPRAGAPQIASLAYLERGCIAWYRELHAKHVQRLAEAPPPPREHVRKPIAVGDVLAGLLRQVRS
jgi:hypothetical protein